MIDNQIYLTLCQSLRLLWHQGGIFMIDSTLNKTHVEEYCNNEGIQYMPVCINSWNKSVLQMLNDSDAFHNIDFSLFWDNHQQEEDALVNFFAMFVKSARYCFISKPTITFRCTKAACGIFIALWFSSEAQLRLYVSTTHTTTPW